MVNKQHTVYRNKCLQPYTDPGIHVNERQLAEHTGKENPTCLEQLPLPASLAPFAPLPLPSGTTGIAAVQQRMGTLWLTPH